MRQNHSLSYYKKNFIPLISMAFLPSLLLVLFTKNEMIGDFFFVFIKDIRGFRIEKMYDVYKYFSLMNFNFIPVWLLVVIIAALFAGLIFSAVDRNMRIKVDLKIRFYTLWRDSVPVVAIFAALNLVLVELCALAVTGMILIFNLFLKGTPFLFVVSLLITAAIYIFYSAIFTFLSVTVPSILIDGYSFRYAAGYSVSLVQKKFREIYMKVIMPFFLSCVALSAFKILFDKIFGAIGFLLFFNLVKFIFYLFWLSYLPVLCINNYFYLINAKRDIFGRLR